MEKVNEKVKGRKVWRQGDVLFFELSRIPKEAKTQGNELRIEGEEGHVHLMQNVLVKGNGDQTYVEVQEPAEIKHEEHGVLLVPPGFYEVRQTRSYSRGVGD